MQGDYLGQILRQGDISPGVMLVAVAVAFGLGAMHALSPGHGKTIVAAYLVGTRGALRHAVFLGGMVTFTHTISVFAVGLTTLYLSQYVMPEKIMPVLGAISGVAIVWIGGSLLVHRLRHARGADHHHHQHGHTHGHDGHSHTHAPEGEVTMGSLIALAVSGGMVPCPSAMVLLLSAIALGRVAVGLVLLVAFSMGLALVLMAIGAAVLYAKHLIPDRKKTADNPWFRWTPVFSAALITFVGLMMTAASIGLIRAPV
jgi:ABC-type nickel/cobalt efflux system permease component RcnA